MQVLGTEGSTTPQGGEQTGTLPAAPLNTTPIAGATETGTTTTEAGAATVQGEDTSTTTKAPVKVKAAKKSAVAKTGTKPVKAAVKAAKVPAVKKAATPKAPKEPKPPKAPRVKAEPKPRLPAKEAMGLRNRYSFGAAFIRVALEGKHHDHDKLAAFGAALEAAKPKSVGKTFEQLKAMEHEELSILIQGFITLTPDAEFPKNFKLEA